MRTIRVTGKGQIRLKPDLTRITLSQEGLCPEYGETLRRSAEDSAGLRELLAGLGFERDELKTLSFSVDTEYEGVQENGEYKQRFAGYRYRHAMKMEFPSDNDRLGRILYALANSPQHPEFRLSYTVRDPEAAKNELLSRAVTDAKKKALVLAEAADVALKKIRMINYSFGEQSFEARPMNRMLMAKNSADAAGRYDIDIEPDAIEVTDTVTVIWEID